MFEFFYDHLIYCCLFSSPRCSTFVIQVKYTLISTSQVKIRRSNINFLITWKTSSRFDSFMLFPLSLAPWLVWDQGIWWEDNDLVCNSALFIFHTMSVLPDIIVTEIQDLLHFQAVLLMIWPLFCKNCFHFYLLNNKNQLVYGFMTCEAFWVVPLQMVNIKIP